MKNSEEYLHPKQNINIKYMMVGIYLSIFTAIDLLTSIFCGRFSLLFYLIIIFGGYRSGNKMILKHESGYHHSRAKQLLALVILLIGLSSAVLLSVHHPSSSSKCAWRSCKRLTGVGLFVSPFPGPQATCSFLHLCLNEYPLSSNERRSFHRMIKDDESCYEP